MGQLMCVLISFLARAFIARMILEDDSRLKFRPYNNIGQNSFRSTCDKVPKSHGLTQIFIYDQDTHLDFPIFDIKAKVQLSSLVPKYGNMRCPINRYLLLLAGIARCFGCARASVPVQYW